MKNNNISYPHPVDGIGSSFKNPINLDDFQLGVDEKDAENFHFSVQLKTKSINIENLIKNGKAEYLCEVDCRYTFFRESKSSKSNEIEFCFPRKRVYHEPCAVQCRENHQSAGSR